MSSDANRTNLEPSAENGALTMERLEEFRQSFDAKPSNRLMQNAVTQHDVNDIALNRSIVPPRSCLRCRTTLRWQYRRCGG